MRQLQQSDESLSAEAERRRKLLFAGLAGLSLGAFAGCNAGSRSANLLIGQHLPEHDFSTLEGGEFALRPALGPCLINFWATWCPPCRAEMASLNRFYKTSQPRGLGVFSVSVDQDIYLVREFLLATPLAFPVLLDPAGPSARRDYRVGGFPTTFLVGRSGRIKEIWVGERNWDAPAVRTASATLLAD